MPVLAGVDPSQRIADTTFAQAMAIIGQLPSLLPKGFDRSAWGNYVAGQAQRLAGQACVPYEDAIKDCLLMTPVFSALTVVGAGATEEIDLQPDAGWLDAYYFDIALLTAAGVAVAPEAVTMTQPQIVGCPLPPCSSGERASGRFMQALEGCCCGRPLRAIIGPAGTGNGALRVSVTNLTAAAVSVQTMAMGFCEDTRICV